MDHTWHFRTHKFIPQNHQYSYYFYTGNFIFTGSFHGLTSQDMILDHARLRVCEKWIYIYENVMYGPLQFTVQDCGHVFYCVHCSYAGRVTHRYYYTLTVQFVEGAFLYIATICENPVVWFPLFDPEKNSGPLFGQLKKKTGSLTSPKNYGLACNWYLLGTLKWNKYSSRRRSDIQISVLF